MYADINNVSVFSMREDYSAPSRSSDFNASIEILITASALILHETSVQIRLPPVLDRFMAIEKVICATLRRGVFVFSQIFVRRSGNGNMRKSFTAVGRVFALFFSFVSRTIAWECVCCISVFGARVSARERADGRRSEGREDNVESSQSFRLLLRHRSFMAARDSIKRRTRHHGRPINPQTKVDYDFARGHRSRLLLRPVACTRACA